MAPQAIKDLLKIRPVQQDVLKKDANGKLKKFGEKTVYVADPVRLLIARSLFTSRGVSYLDQVFGNDLQGLIKVLKTTTGVKPQQVDLEAQAGFKERDQKRELEDLLTRNKEGALYTNFYVPEEK
jgi:deoxyxylulose-5-phosphate synthase